MSDDLKILKRERDEAIVVIKRLQKERDVARAEVERWKRAIKAFAAMCVNDVYGPKGRKLKRYIQGMAAIDSGELEALEKALGIKP